MLDMFYQFHISSIARLVLSCPILRFSFRFGMEMTLVKSLGSVPDLTWIADTETFGTYASLKNFSASLSEYYCVELLLRSPNEFYASHWISTSVVYMATHHGWGAATDYIVCLQGKWRDGRIDFAKFFASSDFRRGRVKKAPHWTSYREALGDMEARGSSEDDDDFSGNEGDYSGDDSSGGGSSSD
jgi:hypothetical protein